MSLPLLASVSLVLLWLGYRFYGGFIARQYALDPHRVTPATRVNDGVDFVPTKPFYLLAQHFSAIAAAGPIAGPILAAQAYGWLPALFWIGFGVVFIGAVHDFSTLIASVRHDAKTIAEVVRVNLGERAWLALMIFIWVALMYVIVAFADLTAGTFVSGDTDVAGLSTPFNKGGAVAAASLTYLMLAVVMGLLQRFLKAPLWLMTVLFVPATFAAVWGGTQVSQVLVLTFADDPHRLWVLIIMGYCFVASLLPVWLLLQPRGYLGGFVLYTALLVGVVGMFLGGFEVQLPAVAESFPPGVAGMMFPFSFVTIACGACSGFHGLVCSGTTSKQIANETHCHSVGYGAMLMEGFVAIIALATIMIAGATPAGATPLPPGAVYAQGLGRFMTVLIGEKHQVFAITFAAMAFSTFIFDTLDVCTRLGRYIIQELFSWSGRKGAILATLITCVVPAVFLYQAPRDSYRAFWTLFGTSNQLLAAMSLLGICVWLRRAGKRYWYAFWPMVFVLTVTVCSLVLQGFELLTKPDKLPTDWINTGVVALLLLLAATLSIEAARAWRLPAGASGAVATG